ncbi:hypothetical protein GCM10009799_13180 [Nocardiopsis rhodophaea]|uniref:Integral membrane protein n=1 Tax=Nocardiopsis rhodophaea TaxID=280238 RepID=A0ABN2SNI2_9ACTN
MTTKENDKNPPQRALPAFHPDLPNEAITALSSDTSKLLSSNETPGRKSSLPTEQKEREPLSNGGKVALAVALLILTGLLSGGVLWLTTIIMPLIMGIFALLVLGGIVMAFRAGGCWIGLLSIVLAATLITVVEALGDTGVSWLLTGATALLGLLFTFATLFSDPSQDTTGGKARKIDPEQAAHHYQGQYIIPADLGDEEIRFLQRVQRARQRVRPAASALGDGFDGQHADMVLRDQEWRLARVLLKQTRLRTDLNKRFNAAVSDTVRSSLQPQHDAINSSREAISSRVEAIEDYVRKIDRAVAAQREWEQIEANIARNDEYGDLLAEATADFPGGDHLQSGEELQSIRETRDAAIRQALEAGKWLSNAADVA